MKLIKIPQYYFSRLQPFDISEFFLLLSFDNISAERNKDAQVEGATSVVGKDGAGAWAVPL